MDAVKFFGAVGIIGALVGTASALRVGIASACPIIVEYLDSIQH